ncbi:hypothetical protein [Streptomyces sp. NPDC055681]
MAQTACGPPHPMGADPVPYEVTVHVEVRVPHHPHRLGRVIGRGGRSSEVGAPSLDQTTRPAPTPDRR